MPPIVLIYNPSSGKGKAGRLRPRLLGELDGQAFRYDVLLTQGEGDAERFAWQAAQEGREVLAVAGGDGTIQEALNGLMAAQKEGLKLPILGVLPVGRGNDFAYGAGIPLDWRAAVSLLRTGQPKRIDLGYLRGGRYPEGRYFGNGLGLGFDTLVVFEAERSRRLPGALSYLAGVVKTMVGFTHAPEYEIMLAEGEVIVTRCMLLSIMNGRRLGGSFLTAPQANMTDGLFDLCLAGHVRRREMPGLAVRFFTGSHVTDPRIRMLRSAGVRVRALTGTIPAHADGEPVCTAGELLEAAVVPSALEILVPR